jgi:uncharacterized protein YbjT (DUF2867 family)
MAKKVKKSTIVVIGATGRQGGATLRHLQEKGLAVRAITRDPEKPAARTLVGHGTEVIRGDLNDQAFLTRALDGADGVYSVQSLENGVEAEIRQGINLADAAKGSGINLLVYNSVAGADQKTGIPHFESKFKIEEHIRGTGARYTILRPVFFMENWLGMRDQIEQGTLAMPLNPETRLQMIAVDDIGEFAALAFQRPGHWQGRAVELAGDELSMTELAQVFSRMSGRDVRYLQVPWDQFEKRAGRDVTLMFRWLQDVGFHVDIGSVRAEHTNLMSFDRWLNAKWSKWATA